MKDETLIFILNKPEIKQLRAQGYLNELKIRASFIRTKYKAEKEKNKKSKEIIEQISGEYNIGTEKVKDIIYRKRN